MLIVCPNCQTSYEVAAASLGPDGRSVRCVRCREVWFATPAEEPAASAEVGMSAAAASAQYQHGAGADAADDQWGEGAEGQGATQAGQPEGDDFAVDPNLAARAARGAHFDAGAQAVGMDDDALAAHDAPPLAPAGDDAGHATHEPGGDIESFAARRRRRERRHLEGKSRRPSLGTVIFTLLAVNAALIGWRSDVVRLMPQTASLFAAIGLPVNLRGLSLTEVTTARETHDGVTVLLVQGTITNISRQPRDVPRIRFAMRNEAGAEVYSWTALPERTALPPGDAERFETRLASPPPDGHSVVVRFFTRRDIARGGR
jgi:predicted Zn finger-like uncharacterized protein